jgi:membrane fusion protein, heavy metal efflux system
MKVSRERGPSRSRLASPPVEDERARDSPDAAQTQPKSPVSTRYLIIGVGVLLVVGIVAAFRAQGQKAAAVPRTPEVALEGSHIRFSEAFADRHHVAAAQVVETELSPTLAVTGTVRHDPRRFAAVGARSAGRVRNVLKIMGDRVKPGEVVADIESADLGRVQANAEALRAREMAALSNLQREEHLSAARVTAAREAELAKADHEALRAERRAAERAVTALGAEVEGEVGVLKLRSPIGGTVLSANVSRGQTIEPRDTLFEVADLSTVWVELVIFERDVDRVHRGDAVEIVPAAGKGELPKGTLAQLSDVVDPVSRNAVARVEVDNRQGWLRPGQSVTARIRSGDSGRRALTVPKAAITFVDGKPTVFLLVAPGLVEPQAVELGFEDGDRASVRSGLRAGDSVIGDGLFALKSEIFR